MTEKENWLDIHKRVFPEDEIGRRKAEILYELAKEATGPIFEIGAAQGRGTVALALGAKAHHPFPHVTTIDAFAETRGWANERYGPELEALFWQNIKAAGLLGEVGLVRHAIEDVMVDPDDDPVTLTFWDLGKRIAGTVSDALVYWCQYAVAEGGIVAINETGGNDLGVDNWLYDHGDLLRLERVDYYIRICRHG